MGLCRYWLAVLQIRPVIRTILVGSDQIFQIQNRFRPMLGVAEVFQNHKRSPSIVCIDKNFGYNLRYLDTIGLERR